MNDVFIHLNYPSVELHNTKCEMLLQEAALIIKISGISDNHELLELTVLLIPRKSFFVPPATSPAVGESVGLVLHESKGDLHWGEEFVAALGMLWSTRELPSLPASPVTERWCEESLRASQGYRVACRWGTPYPAYQGTAKQQVCGHQVQALLQESFQRFSVSVMPLFLLVLRKLWAIFPCTASKGWRRQLCVLVSLRCGVEDENKCD